MIDLTTAAKSDDNVMARIHVWHRVKRKGSCQD